MNRKLKNKTLLPKDWRDLKFFIKKRMEKRMKRLFAILLGLTIIRLTIHKNENTQKQERKDFLEENPPLFI